MELIPLEKWTHDGTEVLLLRRLGSNGLSYGGFSGWRDLTVGDWIEAADWNPTPRCGQGLHGWLWAVTIGSGVDRWSLAHDIWCVFAASPADIVVVNGPKAKVRRARLVYRGTFTAAFSLLAAGRAAWIRYHSGSPTPVAEWEPSAVVRVNARTLVAASNHHAGSADLRSHAVAAGSDAHAMTAGEEAYAVAAGYASRAVTTAAGSYATAAGMSSRATADGDSSLATTAGDCSSAETTGWNSHAISAGKGGCAVATGTAAYAVAVGPDSHAEACGMGANMAVVVGIAGRARAGAGGLIVLPYLREDGSLDACVGRVGVDGIEAGVWYRVMAGRLVVSCL